MVSLGVVLGFSSHCARAVALGYARAELDEFASVTAKDGLFARAILQAGEVGAELTWWFRGKAVHHPITFATGFDEAAGFEVAEMLRNFDLRFVEDFLEMARIAVIASPISVASTKMKLLNIQFPPV